MRIAFFILLLANLVVLLWQTQIRSEEAGQSDLPDIPEDSRLVLLREHRAQQQADSDAQPAEPASTQPARPRPEETEAQDSPELPSIEMAGEDESDEADESDEPAGETPSEPEPEPARVCYTMGPFKEVNRARKVAARLESRGAEVNRRSKVEQEQYGYWVFLEPLSSREKAVQEARRLAEHGIRDYYIITDDEEREDGISLGLFRKKSGAIRRMAQVRRFDFDPKMEIRYRDTTIYWLDYEYSGDINIEPLWRELTEETPDLQRLDRDCGQKPIA